MLLIDCYIRLNSENQISLYATKNIKKGKPVWKFTSSNCKVYWKRQFLNYCQNQPINRITKLLEFSYLKNGVIYLREDNSKYILHSLNPNTVMTNEHSEVAIRDILKDEAITKNFTLSYDKNDFYSWYIPDHVSKQQLIQLINFKLFNIGRPQSTLLV